MLYASCSFISNHPSAHMPKIGGINMAIKWNPDRLNLLIEQHKVSIEKLARTTSLKYRRILKIVQNASDPTVNELLALSDYFGVSLDFITGRFESEAPDIATPNWEEHLLRDAFEKKYAQIFPLNRENLEGVRYILSTLTMQRQRVIRMKYQLGFDTAKTAEAMGITTQRVYDLLNSSLIKFREKKAIDRIVLGRSEAVLDTEITLALEKKARLEGLQQQIEELEKQMIETPLAARRAFDVAADAAMVLIMDNKLYNSDYEIENLGLEKRTYNWLKRSGLNTVKQIVDFIIKSGYSTASDALIRGIRNFGAGSYNNLRTRILEKLGADLEEVF